MEGVRIEGSQGRDARGQDHTVGSEEFNERKGGAQEFGDSTISETGLSHVECQNEHWLDGRRRRRDR